VGVAYTGAEGEGAGIGMEVGWLKARAPSATLKKIESTPPTVRPPAISG